MSKNTRNDQHKSLRTFNPIKKKNICSLVKETTTTSAQRLSSSFRLHFVPSRRFSAHKVSILPTGLAVPSLNSGPSEATVQTATQTKPEPLHPLRQHSIPAAARDDDEPIVFYRLLRAFGCVRSGVSECVRLCFVFSVVVLCSVLSFFFFEPPGP